MNLSVITVKIQSTGHQNYALKNLGKLILLTKTTNIVTRPYRKSRTRLCNTSKSKLVNGNNNEDTLSKSQLIRNIEDIKFEISGFCNRIEPRTFILCSTCKKRIHYNCNIIKVTAYYKKQT